MPRRYEAATPEAERPERSTGDPATNTARLLAAADRHVGGDARKASASASRIPDAAPAAMSGSARGGGGGRLRGTLGPRGHRGRALDAGREARRPGEEERGAWSGRSEHAIGLLEWPRGERDAVELSKSEVGKQPSRTARGVEVRTVNSHLGHGPFLFLFGWIAFVLPL